MIFFRLFEDFVRLLAAGFVYTFRILEFLLDPPDGRRHCPHCGAHILSASSRYCPVCEAEQER